MTRIMKPTPTHGPAPSHAPPDTIYAPGRNLGRGLGWFSIGLGLAELLAPHVMAELTGVRNTALLQAFGLREIGTGVGILSSARPTGWLWGRVAGDAADITTLLTAAASASNGYRGRALVATAAVAGVTALDAVCAAQMSAAAALEG